MSNDSVKVYESLRFLRDFKSVWKNGSDEMRQWVMDQMVRILAEDNYEAFVAELLEPDEYDSHYTWSVGEKPDEVIV